MNDQTTPQDKTRVARPWRQARFEQFAQQQRATHDWIAFAEIADFYARECGSIEPDLRKHALTLDQLRDGILAGEFDVRDKAQVLFANGETKLGRVSRRRLQDLLEIYAEDADQWRRYLLASWAPRLLAHRWADKRRLPIPLHWMTRPATENTNIAQSSPPAPLQQHDDASVANVVDETNLGTAMKAEARSRAQHARESKLPRFLIDQIVVDEIDRDALAASKPKTRAVVMRAATRKIDTINSRIKEERSRYNLDNKKPYYAEPESIHRRYQDTKNRMDKKPSDKSSDG